MMTMWHWEKCCSQTPMGLGPLLGPMGKHTKAPAVSDVVYLSPYMRDSIVQGTWTFNVNSASLRNFTLWNDSDTSGDGLQFKDFMPKGTYTCQVLHHKFNLYGIMKIKIDGEVVATFDWYNAVSLVNQIQSQAGIEVSAPGVKTIQCIVDGKNPLSSHYYIDPIEIVFYRTV